MSKLIQAAAAFFICFGIPVITGAGCILLLH